MQSEGSGDEGGERMGEGGEEEEEEEEEEEDVTQEYAETTKPAPTFRTKSTLSAAKSKHAGTYMYMIIHVQCIIYSLIFIIYMTLVLVYTCTCA